MPDKDMETHYTSNHGKDVWRCKYCPKSYATNGGTTVIKSHLAGTHKIGQTSTRQVQIQKRQLSLEEAAINAPAYRRRRLAPGGEDLSPDVLEAMLTRVLVAGNLPLTFVKLPEFRDFCFLLNQDIESWLPGSHNTAKAWVIRQYEVQKLRIKQQISNALSKIHVSCDVWTSPNNLLILGVISLFVSSQKKLEWCVLAMKELHGEHTGVSMASQVLDVIVD